MYKKRERQQLDINNHHPAQQRRGEAKREGALV